ncbi:hypothetical protein ELD05_11860 [Caldicellulosiruptor changbaiensis]|uniref:Uncharacterized protein n=2 Tax=Caldicellulosiruptor changbaiensis TaxID=1222016 RepID=A0A3T0D8E1_9FIRM|nr:hypothetical protein ELD05_11860 [Caldicellulosiruptor changbaiensis]
MFEKGGRSHLYTYSSKSGLLVELVSAKDFNREQPWIGVNKEVGEIILKHFKDISSLHEQK